MNAVRETPLFVTSLFSNIDTGPTSYVDIWPVNDATKRTQGHSDLVAFFTRSILGLISPALKAKNATI